MFLRTLLVIALTWLLSLSLVGCGKHLYTKDDLDVTLFQHHNNLRWGRLENASLNVKPEMRPAFLQTWAARVSTFELQDVEIAGVAMSADGDSADVVVNVTYVERTTMTVKTVAVSERWVRTDDGWFAAKTADLPAS